jgi:hypothetical protein
VRGERGLVVLARRNAVARSSPVTAARDAASAGTVRRITVPANALTAKAAKVQLAKATPRSPPQVSPQLPPFLLANLR